MMPWGGEGGEVLFREGTGGDPSAGEGRNVRCKPFLYSWLWVSKWRWAGARTLWCWASAEFDALVVRFDLRRCGSVQVGAEKSEREIRFYLTTFLTAKNGNKASSCEICASRTHGYLLRACRETSLFDFS